MNLSNLKPQHYFLILCFCLLGLFVVGCFMVIQIADKRTECVKNPLIYGAKQLEIVNEGKKISCSCTLNIPNSPTLLFDAQNWSFLNINNIYAGGKDNGMNEFILFLNQSKIKEDGN